MSVYKTASQNSTISRSKPGIHGNPRGLRIDFRGPVNLDGGKNYNFIFIKLKLKFNLSFNK